MPATRLTGRPSSARPSFNRRFYSLAQLLCVSGRSGFDVRPASRLERGGGADGWGVESSVGLVGQRRVTRARKIFGKVRELLRHRGPYAHTGPLELAGRGARDERSSLVTGQLRHRVDEAAAKATGLDEAELTRRPVASWPSGSWLGFECGGPSHGVTGPPRSTKPNWKTRRAQSRRPKIFLLRSRKTQPQRALGNRVRKLLRLGSTRARSCRACAMTAESLRRACFLRRPLGAPGRSHLFSGTPLGTPRVPRWVPLRAFAPTLNGDNQKRESSTSSRGFPVF